MSSLYLEFFGLKASPFNVTPDPRFLFLADHHHQALLNLLYGIEERKGFMVLTGEVGSGKTTLCRALLDRLPAGTRRALVLHPHLSEIQLVRAILTDLGQPPTRRDRFGLMEQLNEYLLQCMRRRENVVVILDEAQNLPDATLEHLRMLSNLETDDLKLMQILLVGQPELDRRLQREELRQLRQRVMVHCALRPLTEEETAAYLAHRLRVAGARDEIGFEPTAVRVIYDSSRGIPRLINKIADRSMLAAYAAGRQRVLREDARRAARELEHVL